MRCFSPRACSPEWWLFVLGVALLALLLAPGLGREVNGARRWLSLGPATLQPSEFMKLFVVLYAADYTVRKLALMHSFKRGLLPMFAVMPKSGSRSKSQTSALSS